MPGTNPYAPLDPGNPSGQMPPGAPSQPDQPYHPGQPGLSNQPHHPGQPPQHAQPAQQAAVQQQPTPPAPLSDQARQSLVALQRLNAEIGKAVVGQQGAVTGLIIALVAGGHALLEGPPGVAKTLLVRSLAASLDVEMARVQFTPDLMPADITGSLVWDAGTSTLSSVPAQFSRISFWLTKSTAHPLRPSPHCLKQWRNIRFLLMARRAACQSLLW